MFQIRKGYDSESKTFRLPVDLIKELEDLAIKNKLSLNALVVQCLDYALDDIERQRQAEVERLKKRIIAENKKNQRKMEAENTERNKSLNGYSAHRKVRPVANSILRGGIDPDLPQ